MRERKSRDRLRRSAYRKEAEREDQVDSLLEKAEELREVATDFIKAWEDLYEEEYEDD